MELSEHRITSFPSFFHFCIPLLFLHLLLLNSWTYVALFCTGANLNNFVQRVVPGRSKKTPRLESGIKLTIHVDGFDFSFDSSA